MCESVIFRSACDVILKVTSTFNRDVLTTNFVFNNKLTTVLPIQCVGKKRKFRLEKKI